MADMNLPPLEPCSLNPARPRRHSSFHRRSKQPNSGTPEIAVHVLLPKIFGGQIVPYEDGIDSDDGNVSSPDSAVMVATPQGMEDIPFLTLSTPRDPTYQLVDEPSVLKASVPSVSPNHNMSKRPRRDNEKSNSAARPGPTKPRTRKPPRPRLDRNGAPYTPEPASPCSSNESTPRMRCQDQPKIRPIPAAVNQLSGALDHLCHLAVKDDSRCSLDKTVIEDNRPFNGFLGGPAVNGGKRSLKQTVEKTVLANGKELRGREIVFDFAPRLKEASSW
ncbi:hypothetical protein PRZ48_005451 [Zasmidium cellare]|uniref:Uncharacterized protein n=1 Tax=Zasmidium cellare TaxID=395010 RepID=A0ABR0ETE8_ZASCE|nr:hypothetical protein PRZ48_005451 [Zasmidium cellare]